MALTDEQRSLLQLLLEGGQGYGDIASLLGIGTDQVRLRAREALTEIGGADPDAQVAVSDFLLGHADPIGRADAVRHLQNDPEANELAARIISQLRLLAPAAELPQIPEPRGGRRAAPTPASPGAGAEGSTDPGPARRGAGLSAMRSRLGEPGGDKQKLAIAAALAGVLLLVVIGVVLVLGGDDDGSSAGTETSPGDEELVIVQLAPLRGGGDASGQAVFAQTQDQPLLQINLTGLQPAGRNQSYIVWLYNSPRIAFPLARDRVGENGNLTGAAAIPQQILPLLGQFGCVDVSLASNRQTQAALQSAVDGQSLPSHSGKTVLRGQIPSTPGQQAPTGSDAVCNQNAQAGAGADGAGADGGGGADANGGDGSAP